MGKILIIDDDQAYAETLKVFLSSYFSWVKYATSGPEGLEIVKKENPDVVLSDLKMPEMDGLEVLNRIKEIDERIAVIIITAYEQSDYIVKAMQLGAYDYFDKSYDLERIKLIVKKTIEGKRNNDALVVKLNEDYDNIKNKNYMVGDSEAMKEIFKKVGKVSSTRVNVLVQGESGTGKELITRMIHYSGVTRNDPFVAVNCSALPEPLLESELFGHVQGAFTGALRNKKGKFELAGNGTIFLDEISEFSPSLQVKMLRVIQEKEFEPVGSEETIKLNARIVAATNKDLTGLVEEGSFREDLFYRLNIFSITLPPLRERKEEIPKLVIHFLRKINLTLHKNVNSVPFEVLEMLQEYKWIGNIRELENTLMQAVLLAKGNVLEKEYINFISNNIAKEKNNKLCTLQEVEKAHIKYVLGQVKGNKTEASKILGITKATLYNKLKLYQI